MLEQVAEVFSNTSLVAEAIAEADAAERQGATDTKRRVGAIRQELAAARRGLDRYFAAFEEGSLSPSDCQERIARLKARIDALEAEDASLTQEDRQDASEPLTATEIKSWSPGAQGAPRRGLCSAAKGASAQVGQGIEGHGTTSRGADVQGPGAGSRTGTSSGPEGSRTPDLCPAEAALYQLSYRPAVSRL